MRVAAGWRQRMPMVVGPLMVGVAWEALTRSEVLDPRFFVPITEMSGALWALAVDGMLAQEVAATLRRLFLAFALAAGGGVLLGIASGVWRAVALLIRPIVDTIYPTPKIALLPLLIIFVGLGETAFVMTAFATAFFQIIIGVAAGVRDLDPALVEAGRNYGARGWRFYARVLIPGIMPTLVNALRLGMGMCLITVVVVEFVAARSGVGHVIHLAWQQLNVPRMYAGLLLAGLLGHLINVAFRALERLLMPWRPSSAALPTQASGA